jgi:hypothetical protein
MEPPEFKLEAQRLAAAQGVLPWQITRFLIDRLVLDAHLPKRDPYFYPEKRT